MKEQLWNAIINSGLLLALLTAVGGVVTALFKYGTAWVEARTAKIKDEHVRAAMQQIEEAASAAVAQTAQQEGDVLKAAAVNGKLTLEQAAQLKTNAIARVKSFLTDNVVSLAKKNVGNVDAWIESLVEQAVRQQ